MAVLRAIQASVPVSKMPLIYYVGFFPAAKLASEEQLTSQLSQFLASHYGAKKKSDSYQKNQRSAAKINEYQAFLQSLFPFNLSAWQKQSLVLPRHLLGFLVGSKKWMALPASKAQWLTCHAYRLNSAKHLHQLKADLANFSLIL
jgi:hypothetical protein